MDLGRPPDAAESIDAVERINSRSDLRATPGSRRGAARIFAGHGGGTVNLSVPISGEGHRFVVSGVRENRFMVRSRPISLLPLQKEFPLRSPRGRAPRLGAGDGRAAWAAAGLAVVAFSGGSMARIGCS